MLFGPVLTSTLAHVCSWVDRPQPGGEGGLSFSVSITGLSADGSIHTARTSL